MIEQVIVNTKEQIIIGLQDGNTRILVSKGVEIIEVGVQGPPGGLGPAGVVVFEQGFSSLSTWTVNHNLGVRPIVTLLTTGGVEVDAEIVHININQFIVNFVSPTAGSVRCI